MRRVTDGSFGQVFITDTHLGRIPEMFKETGAEVKVFEVNKGEVELSVMGEKSSLDNVEISTVLKIRIALSL